MSNEKVITYTNDLLNFNKHFLSVVRSQKTSDTLNNTKAVDLLHNIDIALTTQINELENFDDFVEESRFEFFKEKAATLFGTIAGNIDTLRKDPVSKILRDDYIALSMLSSGYTMLYTAALVNENENLANFAQNSLTRVAQLITDTNQTIPFVVAEELAESDTDVNAIAEKALKETQKAWSSKNMFEEA
ncbi:MAG: hypothetical protein JJ971_03180 [Balneolaceae bacterium]|nr:hypothetical protein [Balneolaceae bacterium]MBO6545375.1 hypothetical protein [Balneolaceae bacterium]MBO6646771.1 hypothetical protein [Balneolaceae bacterium]